MHCVGAAMDSKCFNTSMDSECFNVDEECKEGIDDDFNVDLTGFDLHKLQLVQIEESVQNPQEGVFGPGDLKWDVEFIHLEESTRNLTLYNIATFQLLECPISYKGCNAVERDHNAHLGLTKRIDDVLL
jgi:hypothetical protein